MRAAAIVGPHRIQLVERELPEPREDEVLVAVKACGICGSDLLTYRGSHPFVRGERVPGHEFSGVVAEGDMKGERVVAEPLIPCGSCDLCKRGEYNVCRRLIVLGVHVDGAMAEYVKVPRDRVFRLPAGVGFEEGALVEPLAVAVHVVRRAGLGLGDSVLILGAGPIGLLTLQVAKAMGADRVYISDVLEYRLRAAEEMGADYVINASREDVAEEVVSLTDGRGVDVAVEAAGAGGTWQQAVRATRPHGRVVVAGFSSGSAEVRVSDVVAKELQVIGSRVYWHDFPTALRLLARGIVRVERLITHRFLLREVARAFEVADKRLEEALKVVVTPA